ncbi:MAG: hypothetical protein AB1Z23_03120 [Eubacteriales bacterium]
MKEFFDKNLYKESLREFIGTTITLSIVGIIFVIVYNMFISYDKLHYMTSLDTYNAAKMPLFFLVLVGSTLIGRRAIIFSWKRDKTDYLFSLPYSRGQIYCTKLFAALTMQIVVLAASAITAIVVSFGSLGTDTFIGDIMMHFVNAAIGSAIIIGALFLAASVTGKETSLVFVFLNIVLAPALLYMVRSKYITYNGGRWLFTNYFMQKKDLYVLANIFADNMDKYDASRYLPAILFSTLLAAAIIGAGYFLFKRRSGEVTGQHTANKWAHYFAMAFFPFVFVFSASLIMMSGEIIVWQEAIMPFLMIVAAIILAFSYDILIHKKLRLKNRCIWVVLACGVVSFCAVFVPIWIGEALENRAGDISDVESVNILKYSEYGHTYDAYGQRALTYGTYLLSRVDIANTELIKIAVTGQQDEEITTDFANMHRELVRLNLKSGMPKYQMMTVFVNWGNEFRPEATSIDGILDSIPGYRQLIHTPVPDKYITRIYDGILFGINDRQDELLDIYKTFQAEFAQLSFEEQSSLSIANNIFYGNEIDYKDLEEVYSKNEDAKYLPITNFYIKGRVGSVDFMNRYKITSKTPKAASEFIELINDMNSQAYKKYIDETQKNGAEAYMSVAFRYVDDEGTEQIRYFGYVTNNYYRMENREKIFDIVKEWEMETPKIDDNMAIVEYYDIEIQTSRIVYIKLDQQQFESIMEAYRMIETPEQG